MVIRIPISRAPFRFAASHHYQRKPAVSRGGSGGRLLRGREHFFRIGLAALGVADGAVGIDEVDGTLHDKAAGMVQLAHLLALIDQQRKGEFVLLAEFPVRGRTSRIHAVDDHVALFGVLPLITEFAELLGAGGSVVAWVEDQDDVFAAERIEGHDRAGFVGQAEGRRFRSNRKRIGKQPAQHYWMATFTELLETPATVRTRSCEPADILCGTCAVTWYIPPP